MHLVNGEQVCRTAFLTIFGISRRRYHQALIQYSKSIVKVLRKPTSRTQTEKTSNAESWMASYFQSIADRMPHNGQLHLPHFLTKKDVYFIMKRQMVKQNVPIISLQHFYAIWLMKFKNVVIPEVCLTGYLCVVLGVFRIQFL